MITTYSANFTYIGQPLKVQVSSEDDTFWGLSAFFSGIWLDKDMKFVPEDSENYRKRQHILIPWHRVEYVTKTMIEEPDGTT